MRRPGVMIGATGVCAILWAVVGWSAEDTGHFWELETVLKENPLQKEEMIRWIPLAQPLGGSLLVVRGREKVKAHIHRDHDETVIVVQGTGHFSIGGVSRAIAPHSILHIPKGTAHGGTFEGPFAAVILYTPEFDVKNPDRVWVDEPAR